MPSAASSIADKVDSVFLYITGLTAFALVAITGVMVYFVFRYARKRGERAKDIEGNTWLEIAWTAIPAALFLTMFYYGWTNYRYIRDVPPVSKRIEALTPGRAHRRRRRTGASRRRRDASCSAAEILWRASGCAPRAPACSCVLRARGP